MEGIDYRGVSVMAALRSIPGSPWFLVARQDAEEVFAPLRERQWLTILLVAIVLMFTVSGIGLLWRQQNLRFYRKLAESAVAVRSVAGGAAASQPQGKTTDAGLIPAVRRP